MVRSKKSLEANAQYIAAVWGKMVVEIGNDRHTDHTLETGGAEVLRPGCNSHALAFQEAIELYRGISGTEDFVERWQEADRRWRLLLAGGELGAHVEPWECYMTEWCCGETFCAPF